MPPAEQEGLAASAPLRLPPLYVICDADVGSSAGWTLPALARACCDGGATLLQVRAKAMSGQAWLDAMHDIVAVGRSYGALVIVNDRVDIALACGAGGVHIGQDDLPPRAARAVIGSSAVIGLSTHDVEQVSHGLEAPIDYLATGPVFGTATKDTGYTARGLASVRATAAHVAGRVPLVAIGGITLARAASVIDAGAQSVAVISDLLVTGRPDERVRAFLAALT